MRRGAEGEEGGLGYHTSHSESLEVTERMEVPVSARSVRLDTLVVGLAAVDGDSAEPCVGQPGSASERMPLGPMAWCWSLWETESGAALTQRLRHQVLPSRLPEPAPPGARGLPPRCSPTSPTPRALPPPPTPLSACIPSSKNRAVPGAPHRLPSTGLGSRVPSPGLPRASKGEDRSRPPRHTQGRMLRPE